MSQWVNHCLIYPFTHLPIYPFTRTTGSLETTTAEFTHLPIYPFTHLPIYPLPHLLDGDRRGPGIVPFVRFRHQVP
jgi:hypothetical protein